MPGGRGPTVLSALRIGLVSDTHGLMRPAVLDFLAGADHIIHAGDIGDPAILDTLAHLAPLTAVRGNNDEGAWAASLPHTAEVLLGGVRLLVIHDLAELAPAAAADARVVVCGHSHQPRIEPMGDYLLVNPGSAGRRRFKLPIAAACLVVTDGHPQAEIRLFEPT